MRAPPPLPVAFADEARFRRTVLHLAAAGALAGPVLGLLHPGILGQALGLTVAFAAGALLGFPALLLVPAGVALVAWAAASLSPDLGHWPLVVGVIFAVPGAVAGALARPPSLPAGGLPRPWVAVIAGAATVAGGLTAAALARPLAPLLPPLLRHGATGALVGLYAGLGTLAAYVGPAAPPSLRRLRRLRRHLGAEDLKDLVGRAAGLHAATLEALGAGPGFEGPLRADLDQVAARIGELACRCDAVDRDLGAEVAGRLEAELGALSRLADESHDAAEKSRYALAVRTLAAQADQVRRLRLGRARAVAALHAQVALLERTQLSLVALKAADSGPLTDELTGLSTLLEDVTRELEARSDAFLDLAIPEEVSGVV